VSRGEIDNCSMAPPPRCYQQSGWEESHTSPGWPAALVTTKIQ
jgi:hypothetical protein